MILAVGVVMRTRKIMDVNDSKMPCGYILYL